MDHVSDIFVIGGGINGVGIAADAALRGLSITLCEKNDLASATSSASSKLIHGGLRYLENYDFMLVRKALQEREVLLNIAPHLISPLEFILPHDAHLRPAWLIRLGLFFYDHLAKHPHLPNSHAVNLRKSKYGTQLKPSFTKGFSYYDCFADDARLVVTNALAASEHGATILTRTEFLSANYENQHWKIELRDNAAQKIFYHYAKVLVNASGPWVAEVQAKSIQIDHGFTVELVKGSHIIVPKLYDGDFAYILQNSDNRIVFAIPYHKDFTLIGTTDLRYRDDLRNIKISQEEEQYLCATINYYFNTTLTPKDILHSYSGVRCLQDDEHANPSRVTRDYKFTLVEDTPLITVISGKITTYRHLAKEVVDSMKSFFPDLKPCSTDKTFLPGGDLNAQSFKEFYKNLQKKYSWLSEIILQRLAHSYGSRVELVLKNAKNIDELGKAYPHGLYQCEIDYLIKYEWAQTLEDILWRRTKLGLFYDEYEIKILKESLADRRLDSAF